MRFKKLATMLAAAVTVSAMTVPAAAWAEEKDGLEFYSYLCGGSSFCDRYTCGVRLSDTPNATRAVVIPEKLIRNSEVNPGNTNEYCVCAISENFFSSDSWATTISIPKTVHEMGEMEDGDNQTHPTTYPVGIPLQVVLYKENKGKTSNLKEITVDDENKVFSGIDGVLYMLNNDGECVRLFKYPPKRENTVFSIPDTVKYVEGSAFVLCNLTEITLPAGLEEVPSFAGCMDLHNIYVNQENPNLKSGDGVVFSKDGTELVAYPSGRTAKSYNIPADVTAIGAEALSLNMALEEIVIPDTVRTIGEGAFACDENLKTVKLPAGLTEISSGTFGYCNALENLTIPDSVTEIGENAFLDCEQNNLKITYTGTKEQFKAITVAEYGNDILSKAQITCTDGVIGATDNPVDDTIIQSPSVSENENGNKEYTPEVKKTDSFNGDVMNDVKEVRAETPSDAFVDSVSLQVTPASASSTSFSVDIKFVKSDGSRVQPSKPVTVKIPVPASMQSASEIFVYHTDDSGAKTKVESTVETIGGKKYVVFTASSFSIYTLTTQAESGDGETINTTTATTTTAAPTVPNIRPAAPETAVETTASETASQTQGTETTAPADGDTDKNQATGVMIAVIPAVTAMAGVILSKKRK